MYDLPRNSLKTPIMMGQLKKHITQLLNHFLVGLITYRMYISPLEASVLFGIVEQHHEN